MEQKNDLVDDVDVPSTMSITSMASTIHAPKP